MMDVRPEFEPLAREVGLTDVFADPRVRVWRRLSDRENATLDHVRGDGTTIRLHVKRYPAGSRVARDEVAGHALLTAAAIPTAPLVAHAQAADGRSCVVFADLAGYTPADRLVSAGAPFEPLLTPTAELASALHAAGLHHRDLYLCHFMVRPEPFDVRLIDVARVARLANPLTRRRWIVKDLAQFWYSTTKLNVTNDQRARWLDHYAERRRLSANGLAGAVQRKAATIARHDARLNQRQPNRNVSLMTSAEADAPNVR